MIVFLLLVIIAIMLLGASRFLGIVTAILGVLVAIVAAGVGVGWIASVFCIDAGDMLMYVLFAVTPLLLVWAIVSSPPGGKRLPAIRKPVDPPTFSPSQPLSRERQKAVRRSLRGLE